MFYHLILTDECNLNCSYCRGKDFFSAGSDPDTGGEECWLPEIPAYEPGDLAEFLRYDEDPAVLFYGGEPTLEPDLIMDFMDGAPFCGFSIYTNGTKIENLPQEYIRKLDTIIISIDGDRETTDKYRGRDVYERVMKGLDYIENSGFSGEIIGRMTVAEDTDIFASVLHLTENEEHPFTSVHWQMDANFWFDYESRPRFVEWLEDSYNPGIRRLAGIWIDKIAETGKVPGWYPFCGPVYDILTGAHDGMFRCGAGHMNYAVQTDGNIVPCPCMSGMTDYYCGSIFKTKPSDLRKFSAGGDCMDCDVRDFCGGRCLYSNILTPWPKEGRKYVASGVRNLKDTIESVMPEVRHMIERGLVSAKDFRVKKYNGCEIIP